MQTEISRFLGIRGIWCSRSLMIPGVPMSVGLLLDLFNKQNVPDQDVCYLALQLWQRPKFLDIHQMIKYRLLHIISTSLPREVIL